MMKAAMSVSLLHIITFPPSSGRFLDNVTRWVLGNYAVSWTCPACFSDLACWIQVALQRLKYLAAFDTCLLATIGRDGQML